MLMIIKYLFLCPLLPPLFLNYQNNQHEIFNKCQKPTVSLVCTTGNGIPMMLFHFNRDLLYTIFGYGYFNVLRARYTIWCKLE